MLCFSLIFSSVASAGQNGVGDGAKGDFSPEQKGTDV